MGCASFIFKMSTFTKADKVLEDVLDLLATVEEEGTGMFYIHVALYIFHNLANFVTWRYLVQVFYSHKLRR